MSGATISENETKQNKTMSHLSLTHMISNFHKQTNFTDAAYTINSLSLYLMPILGFSNSPITT